LSNVAKQQYGHVVDFTVGGFTVHDEATGKVLRHLSQREFWNKVEPPNSIDPQKDANDPWMLYDPQSQRWFATVSGTSDPELVKLRYCLSRARRAVGESRHDS
jgi:hypothetical protein